MFIRRAGLLAAILLTASSSAFSADCTMGHYDPNQDGYTSEKIELPLALNWEFTSLKFDNNPSSPLVVDGVCYFASGSNIYALDMATGVKKWQYPSDRPLAGSVKTTPAYYGGNIYFTSVDGNMYCVDAETGVFQWAYQTRGAIRSSPVIDDGVIYFGADDNSIYAVDAETGEAIWSSPFTTRDDFAQSVAVNSGIVVAACMDGLLYGINKSSGTCKWIFRLPGAPVRTSPVIANNLVIMAISNTVYGLPIRSGQTKWMITLPSDASASPAAVGQEIYVPCRDKKIYAYTLNGRQPKLKWTAPIDIGASPMSSPIIAKDTLFVTTSKGVVAAYSVEDGTLKWRYIASPSLITMPGSNYVDAASSPTVADQSLIVMTDDGVLHCFSPQASDNESPTEYKLSPPNAIAMSGVPPIKMSAIIYDIGSGVDFNSVAMTLDGNAVAYKTDLETSTVTYITELAEDGKPVTKLPDGIHTIKITAKDYFGNTLNKEWFFFADNTLPAPKRAVSEQTGKKTKETTKKNQKTTPNTTNNRRTWGGSNPGGDQNSPPPPPPMPGVPNTPTDTDTGGGEAPTPDE
ncbi:PQQ-binding-like beta-propeller repeat protein [bacterium]|nr:PQQ-binding-like beta-propeller repeat protein [bacterium]